MPLDDEQPTDGDDVTVSNAVMANDTAAPAADAASAVRSPGTKSAGAVVSRTVTVNESVDLFPVPSCAEHCTVVVPSAKTLPLTGEQVIDGEAVTASVADATNDTTLPAAAFASSTMSDGTVRSGAVVSRTETVNDASATLPAASCAEQKTPVLPSANTPPLAGAHVTATTGSRLSVAVGVL